MNRKIKIVFVVHEGALSGANLCLLEYIQLLSKNDFEIYLITPRLGELTEAAAQYVVRSYEIYYYGWTIVRGIKIGFISWFKQFMRNQFAQWQIGKILRKISPNFVATNTITIDVGALAARKKGIKHIWFVHEFGEEDHGFTFKIGIQPARKKILSLSQIVVINSIAVLNSFPESDKLKLVYNSIPNRCPAINEQHIESELRLVMLGQIARSKNQEEAIKAVALCRQKGYPITLSIYGGVVDHEYGEFLRELIVQYSLQQFVTIYSPVKNICNPLIGSHALLMCSRNEAFGRVTVEALKAGVPVIASDKGGSLEIVMERFNGYFYEAGNLKDLAWKIINLYHNYADFDHREIANAISLKFNEFNTWQQLKAVFEK